VHFKELFAEKNDLFIRVISSSIRFGNVCNWKFFQFHFTDIWRVL